MLLVAYAGVQSEMCDQANTTSSRSHAVLLCTVPVLDCTGHCHFSLLYGRHMPDGRWPMARRCRLTNRARAPRPRPLLEAESLNKSNFLLPVQPQTTLPVGPHIPIPPARHQMPMRACSHSSGIKGH